MSNKNKKKKKSPPVKKNTPEEKKKSPEVKEKAPEEKKKAPEVKEKAPEEKKKAPEVKEKAPEEKKKAPESEADDDRIHITKSIFQTNKERKAKENEEEERRRQELEKKLEERRKKAQEAHDKRLEQERIELLKLKHGIIEESETIHEEQEEKVKPTFFGRIRSFFYLNKWWMGIGTIMAVIVVFLVYNLLSRPNPDMIVLVIGENSAVDEDSQIRDYLSSFCDDFNGNGKTEATIYYIPYTGVQNRDYANGVQTKLTVELQSDNGVIVMGNEKSMDCFDGTDALVDLSELFPDNEHVKGCRFMLKGTKFAEKIGLPSDKISDDWYLAIRKPQELMSTSKKSMQKIYDRDLEVFKALIEDIS